MPAKASRHPSPASLRARLARTRLAQALIGPLQRVRGLLFSKVGVSRQGPNIQFKLGAASAPGAVPAQPDKATLELEAMRAELKQVLTAHPMTRKLMRHLVYVDAAIQRQGLAALKEVPVEVLSKAVEQLESLVTNWSNVRLAELRSKMSVAVVERSRDPFHGGGGDRPSAFHTASRLHVADVSHSVFMEADASFKRRPGT